MLKSIVIAFSTYSKIPMPTVEWNEKSMKYSMCFFPFVGVVIGACSVLCLWVLDYAEVNDILKAAVLCVLPIIISGGIHFDGFLDTIDAKSSYRSKEERLRILKDPNTGAFAVIYGIVYMIICFGLFSEISKYEIAFTALGYVYSRILSGLSVVTLKKAKNDGMLSDTAKAAQKNVKWILALELVLCLGGFIYLSPAMGGICAAVGILCFFYYRNMAYKLFGGITGDIAGYFLQICELAILISVVLFKRWLL